MAISLDKVIATLVDRRSELQNKATEIGAEIGQIEKALGALGQLETSNRKNRISDEGMQRIREAQQKRSEIRKALGLRWMATNAEVEAALAAQRTDLAIAG